MAEHIDSKGQKDCVTDDRQQFINKTGKSRPNTNDCRAPELAQQLQALWSEFAAEDEDASDMPPGLLRLATRPSYTGSRLVLNNLTPADVYFGRGPQLF
jgi:hypothetical protein